MTANGTTVGLAGLFHRQLHGTGQGTVEGPINWIPIAGIVVALVRRRSKQPAAMPTGDGKMYLFDKRGLLMTRASDRRVKAPHELCST